MSNDNPQTTPTAASESDYVRGYIAGWRAAWTAAFLALWRR